MDAEGARELRKRLDEQEHWRRADAVCHGSQPATDPDSAELEAIDGDVRTYGLDEERILVDGLRAVVTLRMIKTLIDGRWETSYARESLHYLDGAA